MPQSAEGFKFIDLLEFDESVQMNSRACRINTQIANSIELTDLIEYAEWAEIIDFIDLTKLVASAASIELRNSTRLNP